jgi:hypothetical protein
MMAILVAVIIFFVHPEIFTIGPFKTFILILNGALLIVAMMFYFNALFQSIGLNPKSPFHILQHICKK